jgi:hypothetical protein
MEMTREQMQREIDRLKAEAQTLKRQMGRKITVKVSEKKAISIYGFGRFPITIYAKNLLTLLSMADELKAFVEAHKDQLAWEKEHS